MGLAENNLKEASVSDHKKARSGIGKPKLTLREAEQVSDRQHLGVLW